MTSSPAAPAPHSVLDADLDPSVWRGARREFPTSLVLLRRLTWIYILLWLGEGALRKWIVPSLATPLLIIRDPVLLLMYYLAIKEGIFPRGKLVTAIIGLGVVALLVSFGCTDAPVMIELYGLRASYLHLLLIFLIPNLFDLDDVRTLGKWALVAAGPMAVLVLLQFLAGKSSWLNAGAGGLTNSMIDSAYGHIRPSGTFSFTTGLSGFTSVTAVFFLYHLLEKRMYPRIIWLAAAPAVVVLIVLSGSRSAAGMVFLILATMAFISVVQPRYRAAGVKLGILVGALAFVGGSFAVFQQGLAVFAYRFGNAADVRVGFIGRFFDTFKVPFLVADQCPTFGYGLGMGTNVAAGLIYGYAVITLSEGELGRNIMESGPLVGGAYLILRGCIALYIGWRALDSLRRDANPLPLLLYSGCFVDMLMGQFSQPTELGYATIACGLCLAATRLGAPVAAAPDEPVAPATPGFAPVRGQSGYAERLHADENIYPPEPPPKTP